MLVTIFTPTYNRAGLLPKLYESLCSQTCAAFEWIIVDDGSTDRTHQVVEDFIAQGHLDIRYFYQPNGGKHRAINRGAREARGELFFIVDSDDILPADSIQTVIETFAPIKDDKSFGGICGMCGLMNGKALGSGFPQDVLDVNALDASYRHGVTGDLAEVFRTEVMREFPFPEIDGERFCPEDLVWHRIAAKYKLRYFNKIIYLAEYQPGGLTANIARVRMQSPVTSTMFYAELIRRDVPPKIKLRSAINYWRFRLCGKSSSQMKRLPWLWNAMMPAGWLMHLRDIKNLLKR